MAKKTTCNEELARLRKEIESAPVFGIDREQEPIKYKNEAMNLVSLLYLYISEKYKNNRTLLYDGNYEGYGVEIVEIGLSCIKNYDKNHKKGSTFLNYFIKAWEKECLHIRGDIAINKGKGNVSIPEKDKRLVKKLIGYLNGSAFQVTEENLLVINDLNSYLQSKGTSLSPTLHGRSVADLLDVEIKKARDIIYLYNLKVVDNAIIGKEEDIEITVIDTVPDNKPEADDAIIRVESWNEVMHRLENAFCHLKKRPAPYVLDVFTSDTAGILMEEDRSYPYNYSFINQELMEELLEKDEILEQKDIAERHNTSPQTISRAYKNAIMQMREFMNFDKEKDIGQK